MVESELNRLDVWRRAKEFAVIVYKRAIEKLPVEEKYALGQQMRRAAVSIPANVAEGHGRYYYQDSIRFCYIARGSLEETLSHLEICSQLGYIDELDYEEITLAGKNVYQLINGYIGYLRRSKIGNDELGKKYPTKESEDFYDVPVDIQEE